MTQPQLDLLRRMAEQARAADMDVALGWNVVLALVEDVERGRAAIQRYLELEPWCDFADDIPAVCPGIAANGHACHWCELRAALDPQT